MTYPPSYPPAVAPVSPPSSRRRLWLVAAAVLVVLAAVVAGALVARSAQGGLTEEAAQRECRTALEQEAERRGDMLAEPGATFLFSIQSVEVEETWETDAGYSVNGTVKYTLTGALVGAVPSSLSLTCDATEGDNGTVSTAVKNRA